MTEQPRQFDGLQPLLIGLLDDQLDGDGRCQLADLLRNDPAARTYYLHYMLTDAMLRAEFGGDHGQGLNTSAPSPRIADVSFPSTVHYPLPTTLGYFSSGWPLAYLVATAILGIALLIGSLVPVSEPAQVAGQSSVPNRVDAEPKMEPVGRITGMVDCKFEEDSGFRIQGSGAENQKSEIRNQKSLVALGDKFALVSGLMEITYDTGAKVILQGPVTYEVQSKDGGYLSLGKLTARVEGRGARGEGATVQRSSNPQSLIPNPSLSTIHYPLFTIKTPSAIVTDLGTEFGVEVDKSGVTESHVFAGKVKVLALAARNDQDGHEVTLGENESVRVEKSADAAGSPVVIRRGVAKPEGFVRTRQLAELMEQSALTPFRRWQAYSRQLRKDPGLVAYYTFEAAGQSNTILPNRSAAGSALDGRVDGADWVYGRLPGKYALLFHGPGSGDKVVLPEQNRFNFTGPFSLAVWFKVGRFEAIFQTLAGKGWNSWRLQRYGDSNVLTFDTRGHENTSGQSAVADGRWHLAVATYEPRGNTAHTRLYSDGRLDAQAKVSSPLEKNHEPVCLGAASTIPGRELSGFIDEVALFARALSDNEVEAMFQAGNPARASDARPVRAK